MTKQNLDIDRYDQTVTATKTTEGESRDLDRQPKIELNRYDRKSMLYDDNIAISSANDTIT